jgi:hypothetical protein
MKKYIKFSVEPPSRDSTNILVSMLVHWFLLVHTILSLKN